MMYQIAVLTIQNTWRYYIYCRRKPKLLKSRSSYSRSYINDISAAAYAIQVKESIYVYINICIYMNIYSNIYAYIYTYVYMHTCICIRVYTYVYMHIYIYVYINIYIHTYTIQFCWRSFCSKRIFRYFSELIRFKLQGAPADLLRSICPNESGIYVYIYIYLYMYIYICMYIQVSVSSSELL
jgi:hypothetical protein